jgi:LysR family transcriptional regulator for bpeEF and oprC
MFMRIVETGRFSAAARELGVTQSTASKLIAGLEEHLKIRLLHRSSRSLSLTEEGQAYYEATARVLAEIEAAEGQARGRKAAPSGTLSVTLSAGFGRLLVVPLLPQFFEHYPDLSIDIVVSDRFADLVEEGLDLAIRIGQLADSSLIARRLGTSHFVTLASPLYLAERGEPQTPQDLHSHACVAFTFEGSPRHWRFNSAEGLVTIRPKARVRANDAENIRAAVLAGLGISNVPSWLFAKELTSGAVKAVLKEHPSPGLPIQALYPGSRNTSLKVRVFIDFLAGMFAANPFLQPPVNSSEE